MASRTMRLRVKGVAPCVALAATMLALPAGAATVSLAGTGQLAYTFEAVGNSNTGTFSTMTGNDYLLAVPGQYAFFNQFTTPQDPAFAIGTGVGAYVFQDSYVFTVGSGTDGNVLTASLSFSGPTGPLFDIANLQLRLYRVGGVPAAAYVGPVSGVPGASLLQAWAGPAPGQNNVVLQFANALAGTYVLDVAGIADGSNGGTYVGSLNLTSPVPVPGAAWLFGSGIAALGFARRRRQV